MARTKAEWKKEVENTIKNLFSDFFYYDREEDEDLPVNKIEELVQTGVITKQEIKDMFLAHIDQNIA